MEEPAAAPPGNAPADFVFVNPVVGVQTPANRFGRPNVEREIRAKLLEPFQNPMFVVDEEFEDTDSDDDDSVPAQPVDVGGGGGDDAPGDGPEDGPEADSDDESTASAPPPAHETLQFARQRMNLTVLSQRYNLYFVVYRGRILVYSPQNAPQVLRDGPILVLQPPPSPVASLCQGFVDPASGHEINHIIVGELGDAEVLVAAYDDGDVVGYYTHAIAAAVEHSARHHKGWMSTPRPPREFFHAAVGRSAWGLALHKKSRLLAVSCNLHEITVFAFSLREPGDLSGEREPAPITTFHDFGQGPVKDYSPVLSSSGLTSNSLERHLRSRSRDWRIILTQPMRAGANIPTIAFLDDEDGEADKVVAADINGACWLHPIWDLGAAVSRVPMWREERCISWGVMVLPDAFFRQAQTVEEFLGAPASNIEGCKNLPFGLLLDISRSAKLVPDNPTGSVEVDRFHLGRHQLHGPPPAPVDVGALFRPTPAESGSHEDDDRGRQGFPDNDERQNRWDQLRRAEADQRRPRIASAALGTKHGAGSREPMTIVPSIGQVYRHETMVPAKILHDIMYNAFRKNFPEYDRMAWDYKFKPLPPRVSGRYAVLRTSQEDVELFSLDLSKASVICRRLLVPHNPEKVPEPWDMRHSDRMCMNHCIPELSLVVVGSACGRVALLRLTKARRGWQQVRHGFRVECVLPRTDEEKRRIRPHVWMVGMAVSQVPQPGARGVNLFPPRRGDRRRHNQPLMAEPVRRWRLLLHFMDHTVLVYTIEAADPRRLCSATQQTTLHVY